MYLKKRLRSIWQNCHLDNVLHFSAKENTEPLRNEQKHKHEEFQEHNFATFIWQYIS